MASKPDKQYRAVMGIVQFEPREAEANGKDIRNIVIREVGFGEQSVNVSATLWPSHEEVEVNEGDVVLMEGSYTQNKVAKDDGSKRTYHNLSVSKILVLGSADAGVRIETVNDDGDDDTADDDDIPF